MKLEFDEASLENFELFFQEADDNKVSEY